MRNYVLITLLIAVLSAGVVFAADNLINTSQIDNHTDDGGLNESTNQENAVEHNNKTMENTTDKNVVGETPIMNSDFNNTTHNLTNYTETPVPMMETGLPVVALVLVVLAAIGLYRKD